MYLVQLWTKEKSRYDVEGTYTFEIRDTHIVKLWAHLNTTVKKV